MSRTSTATAQALARKAADDYFAALAAEIPYDTAPGDVHLIDRVCDIQEAVLKAGKRDGQDAAFTAGYLLGVEIGRRLGGVR